MIPAERHIQIINFLQGKEVVSLKDISDKLGISLSTIRRDAKQLSKDGQVQLLRGGAIRLPKELIELNLDAKMMLHREEKNKIARFAASFIGDGEVVFLDPASTNFLLIDYLIDKNVVVITNSIAIANKLIKSEIQCILIGGQIKRTTSACLGEIAEQTLKDLYFDRCFLGATGMSLVAGITNHDLREKSIKRVAINNSKHPYFLIDSSKYGCVAMCKVAEIDECTIICDREISELSHLSNFIYVK